MDNMESSPEAKKIKEQIAEHQKQLLADRNRGLQLEKEIAKIKEDMLRRQGAITALQNLLKEIEN